MKYLIYWVYLNVAVVKAFVFHSFEGVKSP